MRTTDAQVDRVVVVPLGRGSWRLCDRRVSQDDAASVIAYVERNAEWLEIVWLLRCGEPVRAATMAEAVDAAARVLSSGDTTGPAKPTRIAHHPPLRR